MLTCSCLFVTSNQAGSREPKFQIFFHRKRGSLRSTFGRVIAKSQASYTVSQILSINHITSNLSFHDSKTTTTPPQILLILTLTSISIPSRHPHHLSLPSLTIASEPGPQQVSLPTSIHTTTAHRVPSTLWSQKRPISQILFLLYSSVC